MPPMTPQSAPHDDQDLALTVVIPAYNESEALPHLIQWIDRVVRQHQLLPYEIIVIDDGSTDDTWQVLQSLAERYPALRAVRFRKNYGKSSALNVGFRLAQGQVVITMDADLQDSPDEIPPLYEMIRSGQFDLVSGWKKKRFDPPSKTIPTKLYNWATRLLSGIQLHDMNCGLKAYRKDTVKNIHLYGEMHRYIPVIAKAAGFHHIGEKVVQHRPRPYGKSKFGIERFIYGLLDLMTIMFVSTFGRRPMHFFGSLGLLSFLIGVAILLYLSISKLLLKVHGIADRPLFFLGILTILLGAQFFLTGFLGELFINNQAKKHTYQIEDTIGPLSRHIHQLTEHD